MVRSASCGQPVPEPGRNSLEAEHLGPLRTHFNIDMNSFGELGLDFVRILLISPGEWSTTELPKLSFQLRSCQVSPGCARTR